MSRTSVVYPRMGAFRARLFSTHGARAHPSVIFVGGEERASRQNSILGPNKKFPLPGDVCHRTHFLESQQPDKTPSISLVLDSNSHNLDTILQQDQVFADREFLAKQQEQMIEAAAENAADIPVELVAQECPKLLKREMKQLFPNMRMDNMKINVLNVTQQTKTDQATWSPAMENERDILTASFVSSALTICMTLQRCGHWADFIDPSSGRPYLGQFTNSALFETDDAYKQMGFQIEDLGCCKVLKHAMWGSHAFVGTIFTDAPLDCDIMMDILNKVNN